MVRPHRQRFYRYLRYWVCCFLAGLVLVLAFAIVTAATPQRQYRPENAARPRSTIVGAPRRGDDFCGSATEAIGSFTALAPLSHAGQTTASHPTFAWFIPDRQPVSVTFTLFSTANQSLIFTKADVPSRAGIVPFSLPPEAAGLQPGRYVWQIERNCFPKSLYAGAEFEVVKPPVALEQRWYDTFAAALNTAPDRNANQPVLSLLTDLQAIEADAAKQEPADPWKQALTKQSRNLQQIIEEMQQHRLPQRH